jgi:hypothetical protein
LKEKTMFESETIRDQKSPRTRIEDLPAIGEEISPEQLKLVVGGLARSGRPTCCSTCSCDYADDGCGY